MAYTTVTGVLRDSADRLINGTLIARLNKRVKDADGAMHLPWDGKVPVVDGVFSINLTPNDLDTTVGSYYHLIAQDGDGAQTDLGRVYVPTSASAVNLNDLYAPVETNPVSGGYLDNSHLNGHASQRWKDPVADVASLPASGNVDGDVRQVVADRTLRTWNQAGAAWVQIAGGGGGASGVSSFNGRTGAVNLSSLDVTGALGYTPISDLGNYADPGWLTSLAASKLTGAVAVAKGGTGATDAATARTNLGLAIGTNVQAHSARLATIAGLGVTANNFLVANGTDWAVMTPAQVKSALSLVKADVGLGNVENTALSTWAGSANITTLGTVTAGVWNGTAIAVAKGGTGQAALGSASQVLRTNAAGAATEWATLAKGDVGLGNVENTALSTWAGSTNITTLGTITSGTWSGGTIAATKGGTGQTGFAVGDILYASSTTALSKLAVGAAGTVLKGGTTPSWAALDLSDMPGAWSKKQVKVASTIHITSLSGLQTAELGIDGVSLSVGDRILVKNQTNPVLNGIYVAATGTWSRAADADSSAELAGAVVAVSDGNTNGGRLFRTTFKSSQTIGTHNVNWYEVPDSTMVATLDSPTFTGTPTAPTANTLIENNQIATTAYVAAKVGAGVSGNGTLAGSNKWTGTNLWSRSITWDPEGDGQGWVDNNTPPLVVKLKRFINNGSAAQSSGTRFQLGDTNWYGLFSIAEVFQTPTNPVSDFHFTRNAFPQGEGLYPTWKNVIATQGHHDLRITKDGWYFRYKASLGVDSTFLDTDWANLVTISNTGALSAASVNGIIGIGTSASHAAAGNHTHNYLPLAGGSLTGAVTSSSTFSATDITASSLLTANYRFKWGAHERRRWRWGGGPISSPPYLDWKKILAVSESAITAGEYRGCSVVGVIRDFNSNYGAQIPYEYPFEARFYFSSNGVSQNQANLYLASGTPDCIRLVRVATNSFEIQVRQWGDWRNLEVDWEVVHQVCDVASYFDGAAATLVTGEGSGTGGLIAPTYDVPSFAGHSFVRRVFAGDYAAMFSHSSGGAAELTYNATQSDAGSWTRRLASNKTLTLEMSDLGWGFYSNSDANATAGSAITWTAKAFINYDGSIAVNGTTVISSGRNITGGTGTFSGAVTAGTDSAGAVFIQKAQTGWQDVIQAHRAGSQVWALSVQNNASGSWAKFSSRLQAEAFSLSANPFDAAHNSPWYGLGQTSGTGAPDLSGGSPATNAIQLAGYFGLRLRSSAAIHDLYQTGKQVFGVGASENLMIESRNTWNLASGSYYPVVRGTAAAEYVMLHFPHLPYLVDGQGGIAAGAGAKGAIVRMAGNQNAGTYWDMGINSHVSADVWSLVRWSGGTGTAHMVVNSTNAYLFRTTQHMAINGLHVDGTVAANNWFRTTGQTGWFNETYAGGVYMTDATWVRIYNGKGLLSEGTIRANATNFETTNTDGVGFRFWSSDSYKIWMSSRSGVYGGGLDPDTANNDYNMYFNMEYNKRGFVWKSGQPNQNTTGYMMHLTFNGLFLNGLPIKQMSGTTPRTILDANGDLWIRAGGTLYSGWNDGPIIRDHQNGNVTISPVGSNLYLNYYNGGTLYFCGGTGSGYVGYMSTAGKMHMNDGFGVAGTSIVDSSCNGTFNTIAASAQPAVRAVIPNGSNLTLIAAASTNRDLVFTSTSVLGGYNTASAYNTTTGVFTVPSGQGGLYLIETALMVAEQNNNEFSIWVYVNNTAVTAIDYQQAKYGRFVSRGRVRLRLNAADAVKIVARSYSWNGSGVYAYSDNNTNGITSLEITKLH